MDHTALRTRGVLTAGSTTMTSGGLGPRMLGALAHGVQEAQGSRNHARMPHCLRWGGMASLLGGLGDRFPQHNR